MHLQAFRPSGLQAFKPSGPSPFLSLGLKKLGKKNIYLHPATRMRTRFGPVLGTLDMGKSSWVLALVSSQMVITRLLLGHIFPIFASSG